MSVRRFFTTAAVVLCCAAPAAAQGVKLEFHDGRVNLSAQNVPLRAILNEWARLGGTNVVNGDRVTGVVTIELNGVAERQALDVLLRSTSGYLAGPRQPDTTGQSAFASILILPTSSAPTAAAAPPPPVAFPGPQRLPVAVPQVVVEPDDNPINDITPNDDADARGPRPRAPRDFVPPRTQPFEQDVDNDAPGRSEPAVAPANSPFGLPTGSSRPGMITPVPQPQAPQAPRQPDPEP